jgi:hypothetical protein
MRLTRDEARHIATARRSAANIAKLPELLRASYLGSPIRSQANDVPLHVGADH